MGFLEMVVGGGFDLEEYLDALIPGPCIAFIVLNLPLSPVPTTRSNGTAEAWLRRKKKK